MPRVGIIFVKSKMGSPVLLSKLKDMTEHMSKKKIAHACIGQHADAWHYKYCCKRSCKHYANDNKPTSLGYLCIEYCEYKSMTLMTTPPILIVFFF